MQQDLVFDVGVNNGDDTAYYLRCGFRVVGVEANPDLVDQVKARFADQVRDGRLVVLNVAVGAEDGEATFHVSEGNRGVWSSLDRSLAARENLGTRQVTVPARRFGGLLREYGVPFYLKIDIEGADRLCLEDIDAADAPAYVSFEASEGQLDDLFLLVRVGYTRFKLIDQMNGFRQAIPPSLHSPALAKAILKRQAKRWLRDVPLVGPGLRRLRQALEPRVADPGKQPEFPISSSGPMAEDTDGPWCAVEDVAWAWQYFVRQTTTSSWYDIHAAR